MGTFVTPKDYLVIENMDDNGRYVFLITSAFFPGSKLFSLDCLKRLLAFSALFVAHISKTYRNKKMWDFANGTVPSI